MSNVDIMTKWVKASIRTSRTVSKVQNMTPDSSFPYILHRHMHTDPSSVY